MISKDQVLEIYKKQKDYFNSGETRDIAFRIKMLKKLYKVIEENSEEIMECLKKDFNKSRTEAFTSEILFIMQEIRTYIKKLKKWARPVKVQTPIANKPGKSYYIREPYGTVLIISPWNYPFGLLFTPLAGAMAGGNCIIAKPSEISLNTSKIIYRIISDNFGEEYIKVIEGGGETTQLLINENTDYLFFTGSTAIGKKIMEYASDYLIPLTLELGGKSPCIVDRDIDHEVTARRILWGKFFNAGQTCIAPDYLLVHKDIREKFTEKLISVIGEFYNTEDPVSDFTHIINDKHYKRLCELLKEGDIITGGKTDEKNRYISPTILGNIDKDSNIMKEEIFGPILPMMEYEDLEDVLKDIKKRDKPLVTYFFSRDKKKQNIIIERSSSGSVCINGTLHLFISKELPFGGVGASGFGRYHGKFSIDTFTYKKAVLKKSFRFDSKLVYPPYKMSLEFLAKILKYLS